MKLTTVLEYIKSSLSLSPLELCHVLCVLYYKCMIYNSKQYVFIGYHIFIFIFINMT